MQTEWSLADIIQGAWLIVCKLWFSSDYTWPIRIEILGTPTATFVYVGSRCHVEVRADFHLRVKPVMLKKICLETNNFERKESIQSFDLQKEYQKLTDDTIREEIFIYDDFTEGEKGHLIVKTNDGECISKRFPIKLTNKKDDLLPLDSIKPKVIKL